MAQQRIAILGFGLSGRLAALQLADDFDVTIFDKQSPEALHSAGFVAAAMLAPQAESVICEADLALLGLQSIPRWQQIVKQLSLPVYFQQAGSVILAHPRDHADLIAFQQRLKPLQNAAVVPIKEREISELEPELAGRFSQGIFLPTEAQVDNRAFFQASLDQLVKKRSRFICGSDIQIKEGQVNGEDYDLILDCRGINAKSVFTDLRGVRGEVARIFAPEVNITRPVRLMHPRYPIYLVPKPNHEYVIGATEVESDSDAPTTIRSAMELLSAAYSLHTGFAEAQILSLDVGLRPALQHNRPQIRVGKKMISINGLYRHGYMLGPVFIDEMVSIARQKLTAGSDLMVSNNMRDFVELETPAYLTDPMPLKMATQ